jgi:NAD(P)-dependent dehydrogenase (short-subunit alcohol dehydrogenase family)
MNTNPVVLITGALTGIGRATALAYAADRARIVVSGRQLDKGEALAAELNALGGDAVFVKADIRFEAEVSHLLDQAASRFGRIDIAINNAGTVTTRPVAAMRPTSPCAALPSCRECCASVSQ